MNDSQQNRRFQSSGDQVEMKSSPPERLAGMELELMRIPVLQDEEVGRFVRVIRGKRLGSAGQAPVQHRESKGQGQKEYRSQGPAMVHPRGGGSSGMAAPPFFRDWDAASRTRITWRPKPPSLKRQAPSWMA